MKDNEVTRDKERAEADEHAFSSRSQADSKRELGREADDYNVNDESQDGDDRLTVERRRADTAVILERSKVDEAVVRERTRTDLEAKQASVLLSDEVAKHLQTQASVTTRDEFLAIVSHDLRNPIGAASSCAGMLLEDATFHGLSEETKHWLKFIKRNVDSSLRLIGDLLDMERIAEGKLSLEMKSCDIGNVIRQAIENHSHAASAKNVLLRAVPSAGMCEALCDRDRISQVLSNLIGNALKFTTEGGSIVVSVAQDEFLLTVSIQDTGTGIPEEKIKSIFERFAQLGSNDRRGLGLGLYISKMLIEAQSGKLWVESKVGQGSTFRFCLPIRS